MCLQLRAKDNNVLERYSLTFVMKITTVSHLQMDNSSQSVLLMSADTMNRG
jgi:hypothetical protein